jgi:hypothetical protein
VTQVVTELTIDASGAAAGEAVYTAAISKAEAAAGRGATAAGALRDAIEKQVGSWLSGSAAYDRIRAATDPLIANQVRLANEALRTAGVLDREVKRGLIDSGDAAMQMARTMDVLTSKYLSNSNAATKAAAEQRALIDAARAAAGAEASQVQFNDQLGVTRVPATQMGATFSELDEYARRLADIERAREAAFADSAQLYYEEALGIDRAAKSARESAMAFALLSDAQEEAAAATARANAAAQPGLIGGVIRPARS